MWESSLGLLPVAVILLLLFGFKQTATRTALGGYMVALLLTFAVPAFSLGLPGIWHASVQGVLTTSLVAYVLLFGIFLYHLMKEKEIIPSIATFVARSTDDPVRQVLILCVAFSPLVESASGFGVSVIVVAPILVALGFRPYRAALLSLISMFAVPWGAMATGMVVGASLSDLPLRTIGVWTANLTVPTFFFFVLLLVWLAGGWQGVKRRGAEALFLTAVLGASVYLFNAWVSVELAGVFGGLVTLSVALTLVRLSASRAARQAVDGVRETAADVEAAPAYSLFKAMSPYLFLTVFLFLTRLIPPLEAWLRSQARLEFASYSFSLPLLYSPGFALAVTCLFTWWFFRPDRGMVGRAARATVKQWVSVNLSTVAFVAMSEVMAMSGMTAALATVTAALFGYWFLALSPWVGGLGGFLTGSNAGSNAMFLNLQVAAAAQLRLPPELFAGVQNAAASHLTMASPSRVLLGVTVLNIREQENRLLRHMMGVGAATLLLLTGLALAFSFVAS